MINAKNIRQQNYSLNKSDRLKLKGHKSCVIWLTGLSGSGKSTIANLVEVELNKLGVHTYVLDGDNVRMGLNSDLGFSKVDRKENIRRISEVAKLFKDSGTVVITAFISPFKEDREHSKQIIGEDFVEVYVNSSLEVCEKRDPKGLYKKVRSGEIDNFTGIDSPYEPPENPDITLKTDEFSVDFCVEKLLNDILQKIQIYF